MADQAYARFAELLAVLDGSAARFRELVAPYEREYEQALWRRFRRAFPSKSFTVKKAEKWLRFDCPPEGGKFQDDLLRDDVRAKAAPVITAWKAEKDALVLELVRLAPDVSLTPREGTMHILEVWGVVEFHSQGMGAHKYAKTRAQLSLRLAHSRGVPGATLTWRPGELWEVAVPLDRVQVEALKRREDGMSLAEMVRFSWKEGCNARVFWPLLPHDFEAGHGFDFFGNDAPAPAPAPDRNPHVGKKGARRGR